MMQNKKGFIIKLIEIIPLVLMMASAIIVVIFIINGSFNYASESFESEATVFATSLVYSQGGLSYYDSDMGRLYPGIMDVKKISNPKFAKVINESFKLNSKNFKLGARITLYDNSNELGDLTQIASSKLPVHDKSFQNFVDELKVKNNKFDIVFERPLSLYFNKEFYERWRVLAKAGWKGPGGAYDKSFYFNVNTLHENEKMYNGILVVEVISKNG